MSEKINVIKEIAFNRANDLYGSELPEPVNTRLIIELNRLKSLGYEDCFLVADKLIKRSIDAGYPIVGTRGSVGASLIAYLMGISMVNPLPPHYRCCKCKYSEFKLDIPAHKSKGVIGPDLPARECPKCGSKLIGDGFDASLLIWDMTMPSISLNFAFGAMDSIQENLLEDEDERYRLKIYGHSLLDTINTDYNRTGIHPGDILMDDEIKLSVQRSLLDDDMLSELRNGDELMTVSDIIKALDMKNFPERWEYVRDHILREEKAGFSECPLSQEELHAYLRESWFSKFLENGPLPEPSYLDIFRNVKNGRGLDPEEEKLMRSFDIPDWLIGLCKIKERVYPRVHGAAYLKLAYVFEYYKMYC